MTGDLEARVAAVEAQLAIQQLAFRYARAVDSRDIEALGELFAAASRFAEHGVGAGGARGFYRSVLQGFYRSFHQVAGHVITDLESDAARGSVYCRAEHEDGDCWVVTLMVYFDRYIRVEGRWHFLARRPRFLFVGDRREAPSAIEFNRWPGREDRFRVELPHADASWEGFWRDIPEARAKVTSLR